MQEDAIKWNARYQKEFMPIEPSAFLLDCHTFFAPLLSQLSLSGQIQNQTRPKALDLACGNGRNAKLLAQWGFEVDALDISQVALSQIQNLPHIYPILADLDSHALPKAHYDLILNSFFLDRRLFSAMKDSLKPQGFVLFETFTYSESASLHPDRMLKPNELQEVFSAQDGFCVLHQSTYSTTRQNLTQEQVMRFLAQSTQRQHIL